jgi:hypothetical protein
MAASTASQLSAAVEAMGTAFYCHSRDYPSHEPQIIIVQKKYNFLQLRGWRDTLGQQFFQNPGAYGLGIDYEQDRLLMKVDTQSIAAAQNTASALNIPGDAYIIEDTGRPHLESRCIDAAHTLRDCFEPAPGGVQGHSIWPDGARWDCTLTGANITQLGQNLTGFVTAGHCVQPFFQVNNDLVYQPLETQALLATEHTDPEAFLCDGGQTCRYSDSAWLNANDHSPGFGGQGAIAQPLIARTTTCDNVTTMCDCDQNPIGPACTLSTTHPRFHIYGSVAPIQNMELDKVGRTSGWTYGTVKTPCIDESDLESPPHIYMCSIDSTTPTYYGDSGGPAFYWWWFYGVDTVQLVGLDWGGTSGNDEMASSPWQNVALDLGPMNIQYSVTYQQFTSQGANDISVGANGTVAIITNTHQGFDYTVAHWVGSGWATYPGSALRIAVDPNGIPWIVNSAGGIFKWIPSPGFFQQMPGTGSDIGIGANGSVWKTSPDQTIQYWNGTGWTTVAGLAVRISVDPTGNPWVVNSSNQIYRWTGGSFQNVPGAARDIGVGADGTVWVVGTTSVPPTGYQIYWWSGQDWVLNSGAATVVSGGKAGELNIGIYGGAPWVLNNVHNIYQGVP